MVDELSLGVPVLRIPRFCGFKRKPQVQPAILGSLGVSSKKDDRPAVT